ncbi:RNA polymerase sigma-70 factor, ECF subfamily [Dyella sp. OK004]|uniref:sigma-70 family RNA polymerase sigma factor n=1 Tax=Dyella sp. OK004 TaxID=1855292 RepID=UPI0008F340D6|nr:sigma-70 family RNA polymerase sigma factor [Dyella sp. OK004]SFS16934.1 RNA polymerase sigma-70 factor, ECF subfamily [Dyella sp. OK004]
MPGATTLIFASTPGNADVIGFLQSQWPWLARDEVSPPSAQVNTLTDEACMRLYQDGDDRAFHALYVRYRDKLYRYTLRLASHPNEAEEVFQEVWLAVVRGKSSYLPGASFASWLFAIAHRRAADRWRVLSRHAPDGLHPADQEAMEHIEQRLPAVSLSPEGHAHNDSLGQALLDAVRKLPLPQREAFLMKAEGGLGLKEIAEATGVPHEAVKSRLRYAQQRLREALEPWL